MEKQFVYHCMILCLSIIGSTTIQAQAEPTIDSDAPPLNIALIKHEKQQWKFLRTKLENESAHAESYRTLLGSFINHHATQLTLPAVPALSFIGARIAQNSLGLEQFSLWEVGAFISLGLAALTNGIVSAISSLLEGRSSVNYAALNGFIRAWKEYRPRCPAFIFPLFDHLAEDYEMHDTITSITADQATIIIEMMMALAHLAEHANLTLLEPLTPNSANFNATACPTPHKSIIPELVAQEYGNKQQWEYVAKQLGLLNPTYPVSTRTQTILHTFMAPLTLLLGIPIGAFLGSAGIRLVTRHHERAGMVYGGTFGAALTLLLCQLFGSIQEQSWFQNQLITFIEHWNYHRAYVPPALHAMFDELHVLYINNNRHLDINTKFVSELFQMIAVMWIKVTISEE
jgi:hypothetical protein